MSAQTENTATQINGKPINGLNPDFVKEQESRGTATTVVTKKDADGNTQARKAPVFTAVKGNQLAWSQARLLTLKDGTIPFAGKDIPVSDGTEISLIKVNQDASIYQALIFADKNDANIRRGVTYNVPADMINWPTPQGHAPTTRTRSNVINDEIAQAAEAATKLVGLIPQFRFHLDADGKMVFETETVKDDQGNDVEQKIKLSTSDYTQEEWQARLPGCTFENIVDALLKIEAFRAHRGKMIADALAAGDREGQEAAIKEYGRAKSWEQDVRSTAKNCGIDL